MSSFSYCDAIDVCLEDAGNYIDYKCASDWTKGRKMAIDECVPSNATCPSFTSSDQAYGVWTNSTQSLATTEQCTVSVDATAAIARVVFSDADSLGIVGYSDYIMGEPLVVAAGESESFVIYNADNSGGSVSFTLSFTGAVYIASSAIAMIGALTITMA